MRTENAEHIIEMISALQDSKACVRPLNPVQLTECRQFRLISGKSAANETDTGHMSEAIKKHNGFL